MLARQSDSLGRTTEGGREDSDLGSWSDSGGRYYLGSTGQLLKDGLAQKIDFQSADGQTGLGRLS
jgi:hypothetical protein